jgi:hypothetical protein
MHVTVGNRWRRAWGPGVGALVVVIVGTASMAVVTTPAAGTTAGARSPVAHTSVTCTTTTSIGFSGTPTKGAIASAGADACFTFTAAGGDVVWVDIVDTTGNVNLFEDLFRPGPISTCGGTYGGPGGCPIPTGGGGTMTLQVSDSSGTHTGTFNISIQRLDVGVGCKALTFGTKAVKGKIKSAAGSACFAFTGSAGEVVYARAVGVSGKVGTPAVLVAGADGTEPCGGAQYGVQECPLTGSGTQTVVVYSPLGTTTGSFRLYDQQLTAPQKCTALTAGGPGRPGKVAPAGGVACFTFAGTKGQTATVTVSGLTGSLSPLIDVFRPTGTSACAGPGTTVTCSIDTTGTWPTLVWDTSGSGRGTGRFTMTLTDS